MYITAFPDSGSRGTAKANGSPTRYETIKRLAIVPEEFGEEGDELRPTLEKRRRVIGARSINRGSPSGPSRHAAGGVSSVVIRGKFSRS